MFDIINVNQKIEVGGGQYVNVLKIGKMRALVVQKNGRKTEVLIDKVLYAPDFGINLISISVVFNERMEYW